MAEEWDMILEKKVEKKWATYIQAESEFLN